ncbi:hypothetical protein F5B21DRAFT_502845 [Xylaria acuta]|nr:hypothetical protein F5B21DRAFT_502845 [Xylaria acuta]
MAPKAPEQSAEFIDKANYEGYNHPYSLNAVTHLYTKEIADVYESLSADLGAKVCCWHHFDSVGRHAELEGEYAILAAAGDLTCFGIDGDDTQAIQFNFVDKTGGNAKDYSLTLDLHSIGGKMSFSPCQLS